MKSKHGFETTFERSALMRKIKSTNTIPEILLRKAIWKQGVRYRINSAILPGKPDIVIPSKKIAVFVDGEFWHGYNWKEKKEKIKSNRSYWIPKIERTIKRDKENNKKLKKLNFVVIRFWEHEIRKDLSGCVNKILIKLNTQKTLRYNS